MLSCLRRNTNHGWTWYFLESSVKASLQPCKGKLSSAQTIHCGLRPAADRCKVGSVHTLPYLKHTCGCVLGCVAVCEYALVCACVLVCLRVLVFVHVCVLMCVHMHVCMHVGVCAWGVHMCMRVYVHIG
jgi:hypothetical protein